MSIKNLPHNAATSQKHRKATSHRSLPLIAILLSISAAMFTASTNAAPPGNRYTTSTVEVTAPIADHIVPSTFVVPITVGDITASGIIAFQFNITYDPQVINTTGPNFGCSIEGTLAGDAGLSANCNVNPNGTLQVSAYGAYPMTGAGTILNITFTTGPGAVAGDVSPLNFDSVYFFGESGQVETVAHNGQITLAPVAAPVVDVSAPIMFQQVPSTFVVTITVGDITGDDIIAFQFNIIFDPLVIRPTGPNFGCSTEGTLAGAAGLTADCNITLDGTLRISTYGAYPMTGAGTILNVTFTTNESAASGDVSPLDLDSVYFFGQLGQVVNTAHNGQIILTGPTPTLTPTATATSTATPTATPTETPASIQFSSAVYSEKESRTAIINVTRSGNVTGSSKAIFNTSDGSAIGGGVCTEGVDYVSVPGLVVEFIPYQVMQQVNVTICGDNLYEPTETIGLSLTGATVGKAGTAVLSIIGIRL
jgi:hypothetical protein